MQRRTQLASSCMRYYWPILRRAYRNLLQLTLAEHFSKLMFDEEKDSLAQPPKNLSIEAAVEPNVISSTSQPLPFARKTPVEDSPITNEEVAPPRVPHPVQGIDFSTLQSTNIDNSGVTISLDRVILYPPEGKSRTGSLHANSNGLSFIGLGCTYSLSLCRMVMICNR